jgi:hypothetical protein
MTYADFMYNLSFINFNIHFKNTLFQSINIREQFSLKTVFRVEPGLVRFMLSSCGASYFSLKTFIHAHLYLGEC